MVNMIEMMFQLLKCLVCKKKKIAHTTDKIINSALLYKIYLDQDTILILIYYKIIYTTP